MDNALNRKTTVGGLLQYALPTIITIIIISINDIIDGVFVSRFISNTALSAVTIVMPITLLAIALGMMFATGGSAIVANKLGMGNETEAKSDFSMLFYASIVCGILLTIIGIIFIRPITLFLGADEGIYQYCIDYASVKFMFFPIVLLAMFFQVFLITAGKAVMGLIINVVGAVLHIICNFLFIGVFNMGLVGAAYGSMVGYFLCVICGVCYFAFDRKNPIHFVKPKMDWGVLLKSCTNGSSELVTNLSQSITILLYNKVMMEYVGSDGVAAVAIAIYAYTIFTAIFSGYSMGIAPIISFNHGAQKNDELKSIFKSSRIIIIVASVAMFLAAELLSSPLISIFAESNTPLFEMAVPGFRLFSICFLFMGVSIYSSAMFTAYSNGVVSATIAIMRTLVFIIAALSILPLVFGLNGVWIAMPVAEFLGVSVSFFFLYKYRNKYHYA